MNMDAINEAFFDSKPTSRASRKALARHKRKNDRAQRSTGGSAEPAPYVRVPLAPRNVNQRDYMDSLADSDQVFAVGPAGTGKTYIAARIGIRAVLDGDREKVCISRVTVTKKKHTLGFLPGGPNEKLAPWLVPIMQGFKAEIGQGAIDQMVKTGKIEFLSFEHLRGRTLENAFIILDEAQNCDIDDLKLFLTRVGENSTLVVCGDASQTDIPDSGFTQVLDMIDDFDLPADVIEFTEEDVVRSATAKSWVKAFAKLAG